MLEMFETFRNTNVRGSIGSVAFGCLWLPLAYIRRANKNIYRQVCAIFSKLSRHLLICLAKYLAYLRKQYVFAKTVAVENFEMLYTYIHKYIYVVDKCIEHVEQCVS